MPYRSKAFLREYQRLYQAQRKKTHRRAGVVLTLAEHKRVATLAKCDGRTIPNQVKAMALAYAIEEPLVPGDLKARLDEATRQIRAVGNNVNQVAHALNLALKQSGNQWPTDAAERVLNQIFDGLRRLESKISETLKIKENDRQTTHEALGSNQSNGEILHDRLS